MEIVNIGMETSPLFSVYGYFVGGNLISWKK